MIEFREEVCKRSECNQFILFVSITFNRMEYMYFGQSHSEESYLWIVYLGAYETFSELVNE